MKLLVIVLALLSDRYLIHRLSNHRFSWFAGYGYWIGKHVPEHTCRRGYGWIYLILLVLPWVLLATVILCIVNPFLMGVLRWPFDFLIFYYCLGPKNPFYPNTETLGINGHFGKPLVSAEISNARPSAGETLESERVLFVSDTKQSMATYFSQVNGALFAVIFWYIVAGPVGVLFYRLIDLSRSMPPVVARVATPITALLDWFPARITVLFYLLVGNFQRGIRWVIKQFFSKPANNTRFLSQTGLLAVQTDEKDILSMPDAENLVWHAVILCLTLLAGFTLMAWL